MARADNSTTRKHHKLSLPAPSGESDVFAVLFNIKTTAGTLPLTMVADSLSNTTILTPTSLARIGSAARATGRSVPIHFGPLPRSCPEYTIDWCAPEGLETVNAVCAALPFEADGIFPRTLFSSLGLRLSSSSDQFSQLLIDQIAAEANPKYKGILNSMTSEFGATFSHLTLADERFRKLSASERDFNDLVSALQPTDAQLAKLLSSVSVEDNADNFALRDVLMELLSIRRARESTSSDPLYQKFCEQLQSYATTAVLSSEQHKYVSAARELLAEYQDALTTNSNFMDSSPLRALATDVVHTIDIDPATVLPRQRANNLHPIVNAKFLDWHQNKMVANGLIREATAEEAKWCRSHNFVAPHLAVLKEHSRLPASPDEYRFVIDLSQARKVTTHWSDVQLPSFSDLPHFCKGKRVFSTLDAAKMYPQIALAEVSQRFTGHMVNGKIFLYTSTPQGERNAASTAQQFFRKLFAKEIAEGKLLLYIDDLLIATTSYIWHYFDMFSKLLLNITCD